MYQLTDAGGWAGAAVQVSRAVSPTWNSFSLALIRGSSLGGTDWQVIGGNTSKRGECKTGKVDCQLRTMAIATEATLIFLFSPTPHEAVKDKNSPTFLRIWNKISRVPDEQAIQLNALRWSPDEQVKRSAQYHSRRKSSPRTALFCTR